ncbi:hypothetical protein BC941DRAFT_444516 [Chlamydoabsidia padenii]|nr:hypothetical protein BC941DRAFT_444516 [Chlamydoabsidia padenii]
MYQRTFNLSPKRWSTNNSSLPHTTSTGTNISITSITLNNNHFDSNHQSTPSPPQKESVSLEALLGQLEALDLDETPPTLVKSSPTLQIRNEIIKTHRTALQVRSTLYDTKYFGEDIDTLYAQTEIPIPKAVPELTDDENKLVDSILQKPQSGIVSQFKTAIVEFKDIYKLYPETWLNDEIINFYMVLLMDRTNNKSSLPTIHCFNTFFCSTLRDQGYDKVKRWTKKVDIFSKDLLLVPINRSYHWTLGVVDLKNKQVAVYDSLNGKHHTPTINLLLKYLELEHLDKKKSPLDTSDWKGYMPSSIPQQRNSSDCGVFACTFAERLARNHQFDFSQDDMVSIRRRMILDIKQKKLSV